MWSVHPWLLCLLAHMIRCSMELCMVGADGCTLVLPVMHDVEECEFEAWCCYETSLRIYACKAYDTVEVICPSYAHAIRPRRRTLYLFLHDNDNDRQAIMERHRPIFENEKVLAVLADIADMQIMFNNRDAACSGGPTRFAIREKAEAHSSAAKVAVALGMAVFFYLVFGRVVRAYECDDPRLEDFRIVSADILPYRDVPDKACTNCMICIEPFCDGDSVRVLTCTHVYHTKCIDMWLIGHLNRCPYCRKEVEVVERS